MSVLAAKPIGPVRLALDHPLVPSLRACWAFTEGRGGARNLVLPHRSALPTSGAAWVRGRANDAGRTDGVGSYFEDAHSYIGSGDRQVTLLLVARNRNLAQENRYYYSFSDTLDNDVLFALATGDLPNSASANVLRFAARGRNGTQFYSYESDDTSFWDADYRCVAVSIDLDQAANTVLAGDGAIYPGADRASGGGFASALGTNTVTFGILKRVDLAVPADFEYAFAAVVASALPPDALRDLTADPWQLIEGAPRRRRIAPAAAATLSPAAAAGGGAAPGVVLSAVAALAPAEAAGLAEAAGAVLAAAAELSAAPALSETEAAAVLLSAGAALSAAPVYAEASAPAAALGSGATLFPDPAAGAATAAPAALTAEATLAPAAGTAAAAAPAAQLGSGAALSAATAASAAAAPAIALSAAATLAAAPAISEAEAAGVLLAGGSALAAAAAVSASAAPGAALLAEAALAPAPAAGQGAAPGAVLAGGAVLAAGPAASAAAAPGVQLAQGAALQPAPAAGGAAAPGAALQAEAGLAAAPAAGTGIAPPAQILLSLLGPVTRPGVASLTPRRGIRSLEKGEVN